MDCSVFTDYVEMVPFGGLRPALGQHDGKTILVFQRMDEVPSEEWKRVQWLLRLAERSRAPLLLCGFSAETDSFLNELLTLQVPIFAIGSKLPFADATFSEAEDLGKRLKEELPIYLDMNLEALLASRRKRFDSSGQLSPVGMVRAEIRPATPDDVDRIHDFFPPFVERKEILPRSKEEIRQSLEYFLLAISVENGKLVGTVALRDFDGGLFEIRTLTVAKECEGQGLGTRLVKAAVELAKQRGATGVFTLTMRPRLFQRCGFNQVCIMRFPGKVQVDCMNCPKKEHCDEMALLLEL